MLVPTTILAAAARPDFRDRFRDFPLRVEPVSRLRAKAEIKACSKDSPRARSTS